MAMVRSSRFTRGFGLAGVAALTVVLVAALSAPASVATSVDPPSAPLPGSLSRSLGHVPDHELTSVGRELARLGGPSSRRQVTGTNVAAQRLRTGAGLIARPRCFGKRATIVGTAKADRMRGTKGRDVIVGLGGNDKISGLGGNDLVCGGAGSDYISPGDGSDKVSGDAGHDTLAASPGRDRLVGGSGSDWLDFRDSRRGVTVSLAAGRSPGERWASLENVVGSRHADRLTGTNGPDQLRGGGGNDRLFGLGGDDVLAGQDGNDTIDAGAGSLDFVSHPTARRPVRADMGTGTITGEGTDRLTGVEGVAGSKGADTLIGGGAVAILAGGPGNDTIVGSGASDFLLSLGSVARVDLAAGVATSEGTDRVSGIEVLLGTPGDDILIGTAGDDVVLAGPGADAVTAGGGNDVLIGGDGPDALNGGDGDDVLRGDTGADAADALNGGAGADFVDYGASASGVGVDLVAGTGPGGDSLVAVESVMGSSYADTIRGDGAVNTLLGADGADVIWGAGGNDVISGGPGVDSLAGGDGDDYLTGDDGGGSADGGAGTDLCVGLAPTTGCEASKLEGGGQPGTNTLNRAAPQPGTKALSAKQAPRLSSLARTTANARVPIFDWIGYGNPSVSCNDDYVATSAVITARMPSRVRPDYSSSNRQRVWLRQLLYDLSSPNAAVQSSQWFYTVLDNSQWSTPYWYLYQGNGNDPIDAWYTNFGRNYQVNYSVVYDLWWEDLSTGQFIGNYWFTAWHTNDNITFSDRCAARAAGFVLDPYSGPSRAPTCSYYWTDAFCATYRAYFSSFTTPFLYPTVTFRPRGDS
jgi:Ca2+-binding RTX toxin-like protein